jgi:hypothetical protein
MRKALLSILLLVIFISVKGQGLKTPSQFLEYELGTRFTFHSDIERYIDHIVENNKTRFKKINYGKSEEGRNLFIIIYGTASSIKSYEEIRINHLKSLHLLPGTQEPEEVLLTWYSFNIHGDEASGAETSLKLLYYLALTKPDEKEVMVIDPCLNPDGRERYVQRFQGNSYNNAESNTQSWPKGRFNHYLSDLNRDWVWQIQKESQARLKLFNAWMPHVHADFHEMEAYKSYFFPPAAEPLHDAISPWQKNMLGEIGLSLEVLFKEKDWDYFTQKEFDLLYPSYGDTYATFNGAIGLTLEQGGGGKAGILLVQDSEDTLKLVDRIDKHFEVAKKLNDVLLKNRIQIIENQQKYHLNAEKNGNGKYKTYVIKNNNSAKIKVLKQQLDRVEIGYQDASGSQNSLSYNFQNNLTENHLIEKGDLLISTLQPKGHLVRVLFEPKTSMNEVKTYDISAWGIPLLHHLACYGIVDEIINENYTELAALDNSMEGIAFTVDWNSASSVKFLAKTLKLNIQVSFLSKETEPKFLCIQGENDSSYHELLSFARSLNLSIQMLDKKALKTFKQASLENLQMPRIGLAQGNDVSETDLGDVLFFIDNYLSIPFELIWKQDFKKIDFQRFDVLIFPNGSYENQTLNQDKLKHWLADGGKLLLLNDAISISEEINNGLLMRKNLDEINYSKNKDEPTNLVQGAIFNSTVNVLSPLRYGLSQGLNFIFESLPIYTARDSKIANATSVGMKNLLSGFVGTSANKFMEESFVLGSYYFGNGVIYQMAINPLFRGILEDGKILMGNAIFMPLR